MLLVTSWTGTGDQASSELWQIAGLVGAAVFAALLSFLIVRAVLRHGRYRVVGSFTEADQNAVREAVVEAEKETVGEILPVVVERSDPHPGADWLAALSCLLVGSSLLVGWLPWDDLTVSRYGRSRPQAEPSLCCCGSSFETRP